MLSFWFDDIPFKCVTFFSIHPGIYHCTYDIAIKTSVKSIRKQTFNWYKHEGKRKKKRLNNQKPIIIFDQIKNREITKAFYWSVLLLFVYDNNRCNRSSFHFYQQWLARTFAWARVCVHMLSFCLCIFSITQKY